MQTTKSSRIPSLEEIKHEVQSRIISENLANSEDGRKLYSGMAAVPENKMWHDAQYLINDLLPRIEKGKGADSAEYKFFRGLLETIVWCLNIRQWHDKLQLAYNHEKLLRGIYQEKAELYESELLKYKTVEELTRAEALEEFRKAVLTRSEDFMKELLKK